MMQERTCCLVLVALTITVSSCRTPIRGVVTDNNGNKLFDEDMPYIGPRSLDYLTKQVIDQFKARRPQGLEKPRVCFADLENQTDEAIGNFATRAYYNKVAVLLQDWGTPVSKRYVDAGLAEANLTKKEGLFVPAQRRAFRKVMEQEVNQPVKWLLWAEINKFGNYGGSAPVKYMMNLQAINLEDGTTERNVIAEIFKEYNK